MKNSLILSILYFFITNLTPLIASDNIIAIIDSGVDFQHELLASKMWNNPFETQNNRRDEDNNLYRDDFFGWNFAGSNKEIINYKYLDSFTDKPKTFLDLQQKTIRKSATSEEIETLNKLRKDKDFFAEMAIFGNFTHGTHVAGITSRIASESKIMGVKLLPTERFEGYAPTSIPLTRISSITNTLFRLAVPKTLKIDMALDFLADAQTGLLAETFEYVDNHGARVVNGSFGSNVAQIKMITDIAFRLFNFRKPTEKESIETANLFIQKMLAKLKVSIENHPRVLFVFAAGNNGTDNDLFETSPANVKAFNSISVAASIDKGSLASFSNFGKGSVDLAAPGVGIVSSYPTGDHKSTVHMSGTSQASPFVAGVAGKILEINPKLSSVQVKKILLETVDKSIDYKGKLITEGVVNELRASKAAELSLTLDLDKAIANSQVSVKALNENSQIKEVEDLGKLYVGDFVGKTKEQITYETSNLLMNLIKNY